MNYNKVLAAGNLVRDPEFKAGQKTDVCRFTIAANEAKDKVNFIPCVAFGKTAELIQKYFTKGNPIFVEGRFVSNKYQDKVYYSVAVDRVVFTGTKTETTSAAVDKENDIPF